MHSTTTDCGHGSANADGATLAHWHSLRLALQRSLSGHTKTAETLEQRGLDVEAARVRNQASGLRHALRHMEAIETGAVSS